MCVCVSGGGTESGTSCGSAMVKATSQTLHHVRSTHTHTHRAVQDREQFALMYPRQSSLSPFL